MTKFDPQENVKLGARPIFAGYTPDQDLVILYVRNQVEFHLQRPDGEIWTLSPGSEVVLTQSAENPMESHLLVRSPEWTGIVFSDRIALLQADMI